MTDYSRFLVQTANQEPPRPTAAVPAGHATASLLPKPGVDEKFIAINMPWSWFAVASSLPGKALGIGMIIWWLVIVEKKPVVRFSYKKARCTGLSGESIRQCIRSLERAGLIDVQRAPGRSPRIRVLPAPKTVESVVVESDC